jgi:hypothetical protein
VYKPLIPAGHRRDGVIVLLMGAAAGLLIAGVISEIWGHPRVVGHIEILASTVVTLIANVWNLIRARRSR